MLRARFDPTNVTMIPKTSIDVYFFLISYPVMKLCPISNP